MTALSALYCNTNASTFRTILQYFVTLSLSVRAGTLNPYLSATLKERLRAREAPIGYGHFPKNWNALPQFLVFRKSRFWKSWQPKNEKLWQRVSVFGEMPIP